MKPIPPWFVASLLSFALSAAGALAQGIPSSFVKIEDQFGVELDIRYSTLNNFMKQDLYGDFNECRLHEIAAGKLKIAIDLLQKERPGWQLLLLDCLRPRSIQRKLWDRVKGTPQQKFVADPVKGSIHNFGFAIDLTLVDGQGHEVDMGTGFDNFTELAQPVNEDRFIKSGQLTQDQVSHRKMLRRAMTGAGFLQLPIEWWHFDALPKETVRAKFRIVE